jgi:hypothetical protein
MSSTGESVTFVSIATISITSRYLHIPGTHCPPAGLCEQVRVEALGVSELGSRRNRLALRFVEKNEPERRELAGPYDHSPHKSDCDEDTWWTASFLSAPATCP